MSHADHEKNRVAWNEMAEVHYRHPDYKVPEFLKGWNSLHSIEREVLGDVTGKRLLHLMCQFGMDTLSWARLGADVVGADISDRSIQLAQELQRQAKITNASFVPGDVLELIGKIDQQFDIVYQSYGTHCWIGDLTKWAQVVAHYLKRGGTFLMLDGHPAEWVFMDAKQSYFDQQAVRSVNSPDYCDRQYLIKNELVEWQHTLSGIINALIKAGLTIEWLEEYDFSYYPVQADWIEHPTKQRYWYLPDGPSRFPLMFAVKASKC